MYIQWSVRVFIKAWREMYSLLIYILSSPRDNQKNETTCSSWRYIFICLAFIVFFWENNWCRNYAGLAEIRNSVFAAAVEMYLCPDGLVVEVLIWHSDTTHVLGLLCARDRSVPDNLFLTTHGAHKRRTSMPLAGLESAIPLSERPQTETGHRIRRIKGRGEIILM